MQAKAIFPLDIEDINVYSSVLQYQFHMDSVIKGLKCVCRCYELFGPKKESKIYVIDDYLIRNSIMSELLVIPNIDRCGVLDNGICLCLKYMKSLSLKNQPKFGILNNLFCIDCQSYPLVLSDLLWLKKSLLLARIRSYLSLN